MGDDQQAADRSVTKSSEAAFKQPPQIDVELHARLIREGKVRPSTFASAMQALARVRQARDGGSPTRPL